MSKFQAVMPLVNSTQNIHQEMEDFTKEIHQPLRLRSKPCHNQQDVMFATANGLMDELMILGKNGVINETDEQGCSALHIAARLNDVHLMKMLVDAGADVNVLGQSGFTPLHFAVRFNSIEAVKFLLERNADPEIRCNKGSIPLHSASRQGFLDIAKLLVKKDSNTINSKGPGDVTPIYLASKKGDAPLCEWLIENGADITYVNTENETPLHISALHGNIDTVKILIDTASKKLASVKDYINITQYEGFTALHMACRMGMEKAAHELISNGADIHAQSTSLQIAVIHAAVLGRNLIIIEDLLKHGVNIETREVDHKTPLHKAVIINDVDVIKFLLDNGAEIGARDIHKMTPFLLAARSGKMEAADVLLERGADMKDVDVDLRTCFHLSINCKSIKTLNMLISKDEERVLQKTEKRAQNALHYAAAIGQVEIINLLLPKCNPHDVDVNEMTALHIAASNGAIQATEVLAKASSRCISLRDLNGRTPLHCAAENGYKKTCAVLLQLGANISIRDLDRRTPLHLAVSASAVTTVKLLLAYKDSQLLSMLDNNENSALHCACAQERVEIVQALLDNNADVTVLNKKGQTSLDVAIDWGLESVATELVQHERWWEIMSTKDKNGYGPMKRLIEVLPDAAKIVLNRCTKVSNHLPNDKEYFIEFKVRLLDPGPDDPPSLRGEPFEGPSTMVENDREELLNHPLTQAFLRYKWLTYGKAIYYVNFIFFLILTALYTYFIVSERDHIHMHYSDTPNSTLAQTVLIETASPRSALSISGILTFMVIIELIKEFYQMILLRLEYFKDASNLLEFSLFTCTLLFLIPYLAGEILYVSTAVQWNAGVLALFLFYVDVLLFIRSLGQSGIYVSMYFEVWFSFLRLLTVFIVVLFASNVVFYVLLKEEDNFSTLWFSFVKTTVMMVGELDYTDVLSDNVVNKNINPKTRVPYVPLPGITYVFFVIFMLAVPVLLMNLLVGIAVGDIDAIQKSASFSRVKDQVKFVVDSQRRYPRRLLRYLYKDVLIIRPNRNKYLQRFLLSGTSLDDKEYIEQLKNIKSLVSTDNNNHDNDDPFEKQKVKLREIEAKLERQNRLMSAIAEKLGIVDDSDDTRL